MADTRDTTELSDAQFELLMLLVDGELAADPVRRAEAETLVARHPDAHAFVDGWTTAKVSLREAVLAGPAAADLSRIRGRVMSKLPAEPRPAVAEETGLWARLRHLGFGKVSFAVGAAVATAVWLIASTGGHLQPHADTAAPVAETHGGAHDMTAPDGEPAVIIEDTEIEGDTFMVHHGEHTGDATIIWHGARTVAGKGEG